MTRMSDARRNLLRRHGPALGIFVVSLAVYVRTLCPTVFVEGTGENIVAAWTLGVPHPPGFPLFCLLGKLFATVIAIGSVAYRVNLFAAVMGALAAAILYEALLLAPLRAPAAAAAALAFAFSSTFWGQATIGEVYTTSFCLVGLELAFLLRWRASARPSPPASPTPAAGRKRRRGAPPAARATKPAREDRFLLWFALVFGLGMAVHYQHALLLPGYVILVVAYDRGVLRRGRLVLKGLLLGAAGFALQAYAPLRSLANPPLDWGHPQSPAAWWQYLTAGQYRGRMFHLPVKSVFANLATFLRDLPQEFWWLGLALVLVGGVVLLRRERRLFLATAVTFAIAVVWLSNYDIPWEIDVYYLPALFVLAVWLGYALDWLLERAPARAFGAAAAALFLVPSAALAVHFRTNDLSGQRFVLDHGRDVLDQLPPHAVVLLPSTNPTFVLLYLTQVEHLRPDVQLWSRLDKGVAPVKQAVYPSWEVTLEPEARFVAERLAKGEAVFSVERQARDRLPGVAEVPWACLYRFVPGGERAAWTARAPDPAAAHLRFDPARQEFRFGEEQRLIASRYLLVRGDWLAGRGDAAGADRQYQEALRIGEEEPAIVLQVAQRYGDGARYEQAAALYRRALARKEDAELHDRLGTIYGKQGKIEEAREQFLRAIAMQPELADAHANLASVYGRAHDLPSAVAELELALKYDPYHLQALRNLSFAYLQAGRREEARSLLERAAALDPEDAQVRGLLGQVQ